MPEHWPNRGDIKVGHDVWIGFAAAILSGVKVGDGAMPVGELGCEDMPTGGERKSAPATLGSRRLAGQSTKVF